MESKDVLSSVQSFEKTYNDAAMEENKPVDRKCINKESKWFTALDERQQNEVLLSELYANNFAHGTSGHNQYMLIAKLAAFLDKVEENFPNAVALLIENK